MYFRFSCLIIVLVATSFVSAKNVPETPSTLRQITQSKTDNVYYSFGAPVPGDNSLEYESEVFLYPAKKNVSFQLNYPKSGGTGSILTYVSIVCSQDNNAANATIVAGGIGQRFISIVVEAKQTQYFSYRAQFSGTD